MRRFTAATSVVLVIGLVGVASLLARSETRTRTVYFSAVDKSGAPVVDLNTSDVIIKEAGRAQVPLTVEHATTPMRIAVVVDDRGLGVPEVRAALATFVVAMHGQAEVGVFSTTRPVDFTRDTQVLLAGIQRLVTFQVARDGVMTAGVDRLLYQLAHQFEAQGTKRPVVIVVTIDQACVTGAPLGATPRCPAGNVAYAESEASWPSVVEQLQRSGTTFFGIAARHTSPGDHDPIIDAGAEATGGRVEAVLTDSGIPLALKRITDDLLNQYAVTYNAASPTPKDGARLSVAVTRPGVVVHAPERVGVR